MRKFLRRAKQKKLFSKEVHRVLDLVALVLVWRGTWNLIDIYLIPHNDVLSAIIGLGVGVGILFIDNFRFDEFNK